MGIAAFACFWAAGLGITHPQQDQIDRLIGHQVQVSASSYRIVDVAGEGSPRVGCVQRVGDALELVGEQGRLRLTGPLAIPRIAGPNYKVWIVGTLTKERHLFVRRIGILAGPTQSNCQVTPASPTAP